MGLARLKQSVEPDDSTKQETLTGTGQAMGTIDFMPPEQAENTKAADEKSDIYSLGCSLFYLLAGRSPYAGTVASEVMDQHAHSPLPDLAEIKHLQLRFDANGLQALRAQTQHARS